jgi:muramoyltetrapeptide carboxypeptidase
MIFPPPVAPGDLVAVVAPASPFPRMEMWRGLAWLRARYRLKMRADILSREAYLAGSDARRQGELAAAMTDPEVKAIVCARGGYGAMRMLEALPWGAFASSPKWLVGFSDVTALHACLWSRGVASIHGPHVTGLAKIAPRTRAAWLAAIERPRAQRRWDGLTVIVPGKARGPIVGGNVALLEAMAASRLLAFPDGAIVALEDVGEKPYRLDRMMTALRLGGCFANVAGIVLGGFTDCEPNPDGRTAMDALIDRTKDLGVPVYAGAPFGHGDTNDAFILGAPVEMKDGAIVSS